MINENAVKIRFMECKMAGQPYKFVLQTTHPQYLYQVLEFKGLLAQYIRGVKKPSAEHGQMILVAIREICNE